MAIPQTKRMLIERVRTHMENNFPSSDNSLTENQALLYIDQALATGLIAKVYELAKVEGSLVMPEAYLTTFTIPTLVKNDLTGKWTAVLSQTPISLPLGYSITDAYLTYPGRGQSQPLFFIKSKRRAYRNYMPKPDGVSASIEGSTIIMESSEGESLLGFTLNVTMAHTRTTDIDAPMDLPDDAVDAIFKNVVSMLRDRTTQLQETIQNNLPAGAKEQ